MVDIPEISYPAMYEAIAAIPPREDSDYRDTISYIAEKLLPIWHPKLSWKLKYKYSGNPDLLFAFMQRQIKNLHCAKGPKLPIYKVTSGFESLVIIEEGKEEIWKLNQLMRPKDRTPLVSWSFSKNDGFDFYGDKLRAHLRSPHTPAELPAFLERLELSNQLSCVEPRSFEVRPTCLISTQKRLDILTSHERGEATSSDPENYPKKLKVQYRTFLQENRGISFRNQYGFSDAGLAFVHEPKINAVVALHDASPRDCGRNAEGKLRLCEANPYIVTPGDVEKFSRLRHALYQLKKQCRDRDEDDRLPDHIEAVLAKHYAKDTELLPRLGLSVAETSQSIAREKSGIEHTK